MVTYMLGSSGEGIKDLQNYLNRYGFTDKNGNKLLVDGYYGELTASAVKKFQITAKSLGLYNRAIDSVCGPYTLGAMQKYGLSHENSAGSTGDGWESVPHPVQYLQDNSVNCGPTSWSMGLASEFGVQISQDRLAELMDTGPDGTDPSMAIAAMKRLGYKAYTKPWSQEGLEQLARDVADPNVIVVLLVMTGPLRYDYQGKLVWKGDYGHYEYPVAVNVSQALIRMEDPVKGLQTWKASAVVNAIMEHTGNSVFITTK